MIGVDVITNVLFNGYSRTTYPILARPDVEVLQQFVTLRLHLLVHDTISLGYSDFFGETRIHVLLMKMMMMVVSR